uniref:C1q domain-containing protein n=1 Tax=Magallana gigas TaxID=29159 RepID=A0A8W8J9B6_MAGGI
MNLSRLNCDKSNHHAFTVGISLRNISWTGGTLVFPDIIYRKGTGYNPSTGIFTAPTAGTYVFYVSVQSESRQDIRLDIVLNGSGKVRAMAWYGSGDSIYIDIHQTGTNLVILHLQTGDRVWVKRFAGTGYYNKTNHHAFTAGIASRNYDWTGSTLVFPTVIYNEGTGYNSSTGIFTAPTAGTYVFYVSVQSAWHKYIYLNIVMNGSIKVRALAWYDSGSSVRILQTGTNLVILHLQAGDRVWVRRGGGTGYYSDSSHVTTFSGFKLY